MKSDDQRADTEVHRRVSSIIRSPVRLQYTIFIEPKLLLWSRAGGCCADRLRESTAALFLASRLVVISAIGFAKGSSSFQVRACYPSKLCATTTPPAVFSPRRRASHFRTGFQPRFCSSLTALRNLWYKAHVCSTQTKPQTIQQALISCWVPCSRREADEARRGR